MEQNIQKRRVHKNCKKQSCLKMRLFLKEILLVTALIKLPILEKALLEILNFVLKTT